LVPSLLAVQPRWVRISQFTWQHFSSNGVTKAMKGKLNSMSPQGSSPTAFAIDAQLSSVLRR
jgi:hypothetical protein